MPHLKHLGLSYCKIVGDLISNGYHQGYYRSGEKNTETLIQDIVDGPLMNKLITLELNWIKDEPSPALCSLLQKINHSSIKNLSIQRAVITPGLVTTLCKTLENRPPFFPLQNLDLRQYYGQGFEGIAFYHGIQSIIQAAEGKVKILQIDGGDDRDKRHTRFCIGFTVLAVGIIIPTIFFIRYLTK